MELSLSQLSKLWNGSLSQSEIAIIATQAVKKGDINLAELAFSQIQKKDALLKLYEGRLLSLKGDYKGFIEYSNSYSNSIRKECQISDALSPWYWRQGVSYAIFNRISDSEYVFDRMKAETNHSQHELAHYYQCYGATKLYNSVNIDNAQELLINSINIYLNDNKNDEPFYSLFDNYRCIIVNLIMQAIIDLQQGKTHIAYRKMQYCREWVRKESFSRYATGISEISALFHQGDYGWVFDFVFGKAAEIFSLSEKYIDSDVMFQVANEGIIYRSLNSTTIDSSIKAFNNDYLVLAHCKMKLKQ